jgi:protein-tyrosine phosphatase
MSSSRLSSGLGMVLASLVCAVLSQACGSTAAKSAPSTSRDAAAGSGGHVESGGAGGTGATSGGPLLLDSVVNARQTGGLVTTDGRHVRQKVLIRSGQLSSLTDEGCDGFVTLGVRTVIDMRSAAEVSSDPDAQCVRFGASYYNADVPKILPPSEQSYLQTLDALEPKLAEIFARLSASNALPAIVHCVIGRDRASLTMALILMGIGVPAGMAVEDMVSNQETEVQAAWMDGVLDRIKQAGGIGKYLAGHGVTEQQIQALGAMALE